MSITKNSGEFRSKIEQIFTSSVRAPDRTRETQLRWWRDFYMARDEEREKFGAFLDDAEASVCAVTGQIGAGKTSFVLDKLENPGSRMCGGLWIDIGEFSDRLGQAETEAYREYSELAKRQDVADVSVLDWVDRCLSEELNRIIAEEVRRRFKFHFERLRSDLDPSEYLHVDVRHRLEVACHELPQAELEESEAAIWREVAAALILVRHDQTAANIREDAFAASGKNVSQASSLQRLQIITQFLQEHRDQARQATRIEDRIDDVRLVAHWLRAYAWFFPMERMILVLDNIDQTYSTELHSTIIDYATRLATVLRAHKLPAERPPTEEARPPQVFKVVYTVRDWNVRRRRAFVGGAIKEVVIALGRRGEGHIGRTVPTFLELEPELLNEIIQKRLCVADRTLGQTCPELLSIFKSVITRIWEPVSGATGRLRLRDLNNCSIRLALSMVCHMSLGLMSDLDCDERDVTEHLKADYRIGLRGRVINWLFQGTNSGQELATFIRAERELIESLKPQHLCCAHRLILTYLNNVAEKKNWRECRPTVGELSEHLERWAGISPEHTRETLDFLFQSGSYQSDYVTIYQNRTIRAPADIEDDATLHINPRGRALLREVMQRVEYWSRLADPALPTATLYELKPEAAVKYLHPITRTVCRMAKVHEQNWRILVGRHMTGFGDHDRPFDIYRDRARLTLGNAFYLERVANSHEQAIIAYFELLFRGAEGGLLVPRNEREDFVRGWPTLPRDLWRGPDSAIEQLEAPIEAYRRLKGFDDERRAIVASLFEMAKECHRIRTAFGELRPKTFKEIGSL